MITKDFATEQLGIVMPDRQDGNLHLSDFVRTGVRQNPKRVQLLASTVVPNCKIIDPAILNQTGLMLASKALDAHRGISSSHEGQLVEDFYAIQDGCPEDVVVRSLPQEVISDEFVTIGYANAAVALGFAVARHLNTSYVHSVHQDEEGAIMFEEPHSLKSFHYIRQSAQHLLDNTKPVLLVDDEVTTGGTVLNTILALNAVYPRKDWYIASIIDTRSEADVEAMAVFADKHGLNIKMVSLAQGHMEIPADIFEHAEHFKKTCHPLEPLRSRKENPDLVVSTFDLKFPGLVRPSAGLSLNDLSNYASLAVEVAEAGATGRTHLVLGNGDYSAVPFLTALLGAPGTKLAMISKTPLYAHPNEQYPIASAAPVLMRKNGEVATEYLYNMECFDEVTVVLPPTMGMEDAYIEHGILDVLSHYTNAINFIKIHDQEVSN